MVFESRFSQRVFQPTSRFLQLRSCDCKVNKKIADLQEKRQKSFRFNNCRYLIYNKVLEITVGRERLCEG